MKSRVFAIAVAFVLAFGVISAVTAQDEVMTNDEVISLTKAGLAGSVVIGKIRTSKSNFDMSTDGLIKLKQSGVGDDVVTAMLEAKSGRAAGSGSSGPGVSGAAPVGPTGDPNDPMAKKNYGIYMFEERDGQRKMTQLQANVSGQNRTGGQFTAAITPFGLGKVKTKANLPGRNAAMQISATAPVFYFYLDNTTGGLNTSSGIPSTPNEFTLVRFNQRSDNREVTIAKENSWGAKGGLSDEYVVPLQAEDLGNGIFKVTAAVELKKGEYGFMLLNSGNSNTAKGVGAKFFDFGVNMTP
ncbi:MAG: hypothetical protein PSX80_04535 [bacterium]|nr:hypothetical protein [bacterium]